MQHIFINFLPGSAGNFLSRFLQCAITNGYCWVNKTSTVLPRQFDDKVNLLNYQTILKDRKNWIHFEDELTHFSNSIDLSKFGTDSTLIWLGHKLSIEKAKAKNLLGPSDKPTLIQISYDSKKSFEWIVLNALYKDSYIEKKWFCSYQNTLKKDKTNFLLIDNFFSWNTFKNAVLELLDQNKIDYNIQNIKQLEDFYNSWYSTTLKFSEFEDFKKSIGWLL